jgi:ribosomal protein S27AE
MSAIKMKKEIDDIKDSGNILKECGYCPKCGGIMDLHDWNFYRCRECDYWQGIDFNGI